tara:strand:- start:159 stop:584 length:426 start_codon:yes stop_codon:yes gene_type:complete
VLASIQFEGMIMNKIFSMQINQELQCLLVIFTAMFSCAAFSHHSTASFDSEKVIDLEGVVKEFQWTNPHTWVQLNVVDEQGETVEWSIEGGSPGTLSRNGWNAKIFKPGDRVTIKVRPMLNGSPGGAFVGATLADGNKLGR